MRYVIIGNSAAGVFAAQAIRRSDTTGTLTMLSEENYPVYARCLTSYYLTGSLPEERLFIRPADFYAQHNIALHTGQKVIRVDTKAKAVVSASGQVFAYDKLLIATGASPVIPAIPGVTAQGVSGLRTLEQAKAIVARVKTARQAVILGGGFVALKAAYALRQAGLAVTCIISSGQILSQILDAVAAAEVARVLTQQGITLRYGSEVTEILQESGVVQGVGLGTGERLPADIVICGKGVKPNTALLQHSGIAVAAGILVDTHLQTNLPDVYAAGDVAQATDVVTQQPKTNALWPNAAEQGDIAGKNMAGVTTYYAGSLGMNSADFYGLSVIAAGEARAHGANYAVIQLNQAPGVYRRLVFRDDKLVGYILVGQTAQAGVLTALVKAGTKLSVEAREQLSQGRFKQAMLW
ncbi:MAG: FAD-dependent oxidoreductase [Peptococcaceae bacterium]|nr:FAD-dependent oxidoreductase [Peptococcaceae bacterium]